MSRSEGAWCAAGIALALAWWLYVRTLDFLPYPQAADAVTYAEVSRSFHSFSEALSYAADRTFGFPLLLYVIRSVAVRFGSIGPAGAETVQTAVLLAFHFASAVFFYTAFRDLTEREGRPLHPAALFLLLLHPSIIGHSAVLLTDTVSTDFVMLISALWLRSGGAREARLPWLGLAAGALLGLAIGTRPFLIVSCAFLLFLSMVACAYRPRLVMRFLLPAVAATAAVLAPSVFACRSAFGTFCQQNPAFSKGSTARSMSWGLVAYRTYWSDRSRWDTKTVLPEDWTTVEEWKRGGCRPGGVDGPGAWLSCVFSRPLYAPVFAGKKVIAVLDSYMIHPYAMDMNPAWVRWISRLFNALAFFGVFCALAFAVVLIRRRRHWSALALSLPLGALAFQIPMHVEGRYSFPVVPLATFCAVWALQLARAGGRRAVAATATGLAVLSGIFLLQTFSWDRDDFVMQSAEGWSIPVSPLSDPNENSRAHREEVARETEARAATAPSAATLAAAGVANANLGRHENAVSELARASALDPASAFAPRQLCLERNILHHWKDAILACDTAVRLDPGSSFSRNGLRFAVRAAEVETEGLDDSARLNFGIELYTGLAFSPAIAIWEKIPRGSAEFAKAQGNISAAAIQLRDFRRAHEALDAALRLDPSSVLLRNNRAWLERAEAEASSGK